MPTLNQYASKIANMVGRPGDHEVKERIKDAFKATFANRIRQSSERNGIDSTMSLTFVAEIIQASADGAMYKESVTSNKKEYITKNRVPVPIRIKTDAPYISVTDTNERFNFMACSKAEHRLRSSSLSTGFCASYTLVNQYLILSVTTSDGQLDYRNLGDVTPISSTIPFPKYIKVTGIFESPEEVIGMYTTDDSQDVELPFPNDMLEDIMYQILKVEFGILPKELEVKINSPIPTTR